MESHSSVQNLHQRIHAILASSDASQFGVCHLPPLYGALASSAKVFWLRVNLPRQNHVKAATPPSLALPHPTLCIYPPTAESKTS